MEQKQLTDMSIDELKSKEKTLQRSVSILAGVLIVMFITGIFLTIKKGVNVFTMLPVVFLPILIASYSGLKKIKNEIISRNV